MHSLSTDGEKIFYHGQETVFDASSFRYAEVEGCAPHGNVFAWDKNDVSHLSPQSCGGANCGENYSGYYWVAMGVKDPGAFRWLAGGYASDGRFVYNQWHLGPVAVADPSQVEIFLCGEYETPFAYDGVYWFEDGKRLTSAAASTKLRKPPSTEDETK